jgi:hypothetical protein
MRKSVIGAATIGSAIAGYILWANRFRIKQRVRTKIKSELPFPLNKRSVRRALGKAEDFLDPEENLEPREIG